MTGKFGGPRVPVTVRLGLGLAAALLAAACGSAATGSTSTPPPATGPAAGGSAASATAPAAHRRMVITAASGGGSVFLTDWAGRAIYLWAKDGMGKSMCDGACAGAWPPVTTTGPVTGKNGVQSMDLKTLTRANGSMQVTYFGHPLYYFSGDSAPGQANGQGSDGFGAKWWLVSTAGNSVTASVTNFTPASTSGGSAPASKTMGGYTRSSGGGGGWG